jgi:hypothetical protein
VIALLIALMVLCSVVGGFVLGVSYARGERYRELGLTRRTARLYREAVGILTGLVVIDDPEKVNVLDPDTRRQVHKWLAAHQEEAKP